MAPLLFGAAWKTIDLLIEFALNRAPLSPSRRDWSIAEKKQHALRAAGDVAVLGCSPAVWANVLLVYAGTVEHRHCLIHRTAKVDPASGTLDGTHWNQQQLKPLTRKEQVALARAAGLIARGVVAGGIRRRSEEHLKYYLDLLRVHSGSRPFGVGRASVPVEIKLSLAQESGRFVLDMNDVLERARKTFPSVDYFNLLIDIPDGSGRHLFGEAEACPAGKSTIDLNALPSWLEYR